MTTKHRIIVEEDPRRPYSHRWMAAVEQHGGHSVHYGRSKERAIAQLFRIAGDVMLSQGNEFFIDQILPDTATIHLPHTWWTKHIHNWPDPGQKLVDILVREGVASHE